MSDIYDDEYSKRKTKGLNNSLERSLEHFNSTKHKKNMETHLNDRDFNDFFTNTQKSNKTKNGEITGQMFDVSDMEVGMPLRGMSINRKDENININKHLDFDVYDNDNIKDNHQYEIEYNDPFDKSNTKSFFSDITETTSKLLPFNSEVNPEIVCSSGINELNWKIFRILQNNAKLSFCVSPFCLDSLLSCLYICSKQNTEKLLNTYCSFPKKEIVNDGLFNIFSQSKNYMTNILFFDPNIKINPIYANYINKVTVLDKMNDLNNKINKVNGWLDQTLGVNNAVNYNHFVSNQQYDMLGYNVISIKPELQLLFNKKDTQMQLFKTIKQRNVPMMVSYNATVGYFEDSKNQIIEIPASNNLLIGFILPKQVIVPLIDNNYINTITENLKTQTLEELSLPKFKHTNQYYFKNLLESTGLHIFNNCNLSEITNKQLKINNIIQNCTFILTEGNKVNGQSHRSQNPISFIADHPFIYYVKLSNNNTIILTGLFI